MRKRTSDAQSGGAATPAGPWREARRLVWEHRRGLALGVILMLVGRAADLVVPVSSKWLIDEVIVHRRSDLLGPIVLAMAIATIVSAAASFMLTRVLTIGAQRATTEMRKRVLTHVIRLPIRYYDATSAGALVSRVMTDTEGIRNLVGNGLVQLVGGLFTAAVGLAVLFRLNWRLTTITAGVLAAFAALIVCAFSRLRPLFRERGAISAEVTGRLTEAFGGIRIVKAYTAERRERTAFARGAHRLLRNVAAAMTLESVTMSGGAMLIGAVAVVVTWLGGRAILAGEMTLGDLIMYVFFLGVVVAPIVSSVSIGSRITEALAGLDRVRDVLDTPTEADEDVSRRPVDDFKGDIAFDDVWFEYAPGEPVLRGVSFHAAAGTTTALVGASGAGKSTIIALALAFHRPSRGRVLIDGRDLAHFKAADYRTRLAAVLQDNFLFDGTIAENVAYARPWASPQEIERACAISYCNEFISRFPDGYRTIVGERGVKLSGGQRQRVAIARAVLADPRLLVLDEATSSLDSESERMIQAALRTLRSGRTTFVIAHRLSTIRSADQILVVDDGTIVERGTHAELMALNGRYRQFHDAQRRRDADYLLTPDVPSATAVCA